MFPTPSITYLLKSRCTGISAAWKLLLLLDGAMAVGVAVAVAGALASVFRVK
jgi:hypothetical protein